jgi:NADPH-dependent 2,4-dienoyl-CoA reductase/sulfur reductase-like enzyme
MPNYKYLIVGSGMAADAAVSGIRRVDPDGAIGLIGQEVHPPYNRPPLSKGLWKGMPLEHVWRRDALDQAILHPGRKVVALDAEHRQVTDDRGAVYGYQKLLLATGGTPRRLPFASDAVVYFRTLDDYHRLRLMTQQGQRIAVVGGGLIGSEIAAALRLSGKSVTMIFPEEGLGARIFPRDLAAFLGEFYRQKGVTVLSGDAIASVVLQENGISLTTQFARQLIVDGVVAGIGLEPNVELANSARLTVDNGIRVDASLLTSHPDIYAAGDVASYYCSALGRYLRSEHEDNANAMGEMAGRAMAGARVVYDRIPQFYSDLFELGYEAVGELDSSLEIVADWQEPFRKGVVYYLRDGRVCGVLLWNVWQQVDAARQLIAAPGPYQPGDLRGRLGG